MTSATTGADLPLDIEPSVQDALAGGRAVVALDPQVTVAVARQERGELLGRAAGCRTFRAGDALPERDPGLERGGRHVHEGRRPADHGADSRTRGRATPRNSCAEPAAHPAHPKLSKGYSGAETHRAGTVPS